MQTLLPWLVMMATAPPGLVRTSAQSLSAAAVEDVARVSGSGGHQLLDSHAGQQFPWLVGRGNTHRDTRRLRDLQPAGAEREAPPQVKCHRDSQEGVACHQEAAEDTSRQEPAVHPREEQVLQESYHRRVVRQGGAYHQNGDSAAAERAQPQSDGAQQGQQQSNGAQPQGQLQSNGAQNEAQPQSNGAQAQGQPQSDGAQAQTQPQSNVAQNEAQPQSDGSRLCPDPRCRCEAVAWAVDADCSDAGLDHPPARLHPNTTRLTLSGNNLHQIGNDSLAHLNRLMSVYLGNNSISDVHADAFSAMFNLRAVDLSSNRLSTLPRTAFRSSGRLQKLDLSDNPLRLSGGPLLDSASLYWLNLSHCRLSSLPQDSFRGVPQMVMLDLSHNQLVVPTALALEPLTGLRRLPLVGNPVSCCEAAELRAWLQERRVPATPRHLQAVGPLPTCASPAGLSGRPWTAATDSACSLDVAAIVGCALLGLVAASLLVAAALLLIRRTRRARRRRRGRSRRRRQEAQPPFGKYEPPPSAGAGPRYVASFRAAPPPLPLPLPPSLYDDAVGAGRHPGAPPRRHDGPTYDDAVGGGRASPTYDYILAPGDGPRPPHHSSIPSVLEGCDYYEDA